MGLYVNFSPFRKAFFHQVTGGNTPPPDPPPGL